MTADHHPFPRMRDVELYPLDSRESLVTTKDFCQVPEPVAGFEGFVDALRRYTWPGNVRELQNAMSRGVVAAQGETLLTSHLPVALLMKRPQAAPPSVREQAQPLVESQALSE